MLTVTALATADEYTAAHDWRRGPWALPRLAAGASLPPFETLPSEDQWIVFRQGSTIRAIGGLVDRETLPPAHVHLTLIPAPDATYQWQIYSYTKALVGQAFQAGGDIAAIRVDIPRNPDVPLLFPVWQWITDQVTRDLGHEVVSVGGWWFEAEGNQVADPDKSNVLHLHWLRSVTR